jgi:hypothetical protein
MATAPVDDDFDMPEMTDEIMAEFHAPLPEVVAPLIVLVAKDLHMGSGTVRSLSKPKTEPFDLIGLSIGLMYLGAIWLFVQVWTWVLLG